MLESYFDNISRTLDQGAFKDRIVSMERGGVAWGVGLVFVTADVYITVSKDKKSPRGA